MALSDEKYILLTTFKRDGSAVASPVWVVAIDDRRVGFSTSSKSGKVKRLSHTPRVTVQPCTMRGEPKPATAAAEATARIVHGQEYDAIKEKVLAKYGIMTTITKVLGTVGGILKGKRIPYADVGVEITLA